MDSALDLGSLSPSTFERLVAVEPNDDGTVTLYQRPSDGGAVSVRQVPFRPWLLTAGEELARKLPGVCELRKLQGPGLFNVRAHFPNLKEYQAALAFLKAETGATPIAPQAPYRVFNDFGQQALSLLPARLFRGMLFPELRRLQVDLETCTTPGYDFSNPERPGDSIIMIAMHDSTGWEQCLSATEMSEEAMLRELVRLVRERDPDVIEGHNLFDFDLPYLRTRAKRYKVKLAFGRDGSPMSSRPSRFTAGERTMSYDRCDIHGRQIVDTLHLAQLYDVSHRDLESFNLKAVAKYFGVAAAQRTYVAGEEISAVFRDDPEKLRAYALDDVRETEAVSRILSPSYFHQAQLVPFSYQNCICRGNATRIDALLVAAYMLQETALPRPQAARAFRGALTEAVKTGIFNNVWHADVASLYPSIMIAQQMTPAQDCLKLFPRVLGELRQFRLQAKQQARTAAGGLREHYSALQGSFKVLINSFYGYTGFSQGTFNDYDMAAAVTANGREILTRMQQFLEQEKAEIIEMDTDGLYFVPPPGVTTPGGLLARLQAELPAGIEVEMDETYRAMFSYKSKNYALLLPDGRIAISGAALKSRGLEPFQRRFIHELIELLLNDRGNEAAGLYDRYAQAIAGHAFPLADFAQREILSISPRLYQEKLAKKETNRSAAYELALKSGRHYEAGDQVVFYVTGEKKNVAVADAAKLIAEAKPGGRDENIPYYLDKFGKLWTKFAEFTGGGAPSHPADPNAPWLVFSPERGPGGDSGR